VESGILEILLVESESGIQLKESGIPLTIGIRNPESRIQNPESSFHLQKLESSTSNPEYTAWNPISKTALDSLSWGENSLGFTLVLRWLRVRRYDPTPNQLETGAKAQHQTLFAGLSSKNSLFK